MKFYQLVNKRADILRNDVNVVPFSITPTRYRHKTRYVRILTRIGDHRRANTKETL